MNWAFLFGIVLLFGNDAAPPFPEEEVIELDGAAGNCVVGKECAVGQQVDQLRSENGQI